jgi:branched-chain amino acid aminotransferase
MKILSHEQAQTYHNAALLRGHVVFTSLIQSDEKLLFFDAHIERLLKGAQFLFPNQSWSLQKEDIGRAVEKELRNVRNHYLRLTIFDDVLFFQKKPREFSSPEVKLGKALRVMTPGLKPDFLKLSNYLEADLELKKVREESGLDEVLFFDHQQFAAETSSSNIFVVTSDGTIKTPPTCSYVLRGITREKLLVCLRGQGLQVREEALSLDDLEKATEIWLTNAVKGVRYVSQLQNRTFEADNTVYAKAVKSFGRYGENYE